MSRTYRRLKGNQWWHRNIVKRWTQEFGGDSRSWPDLYWGKSMAKELSRYHSDAGWSDNTPSYWIREEMTVPQRQEVRRLTHKVSRLSLEDAAELMWPLAKKPHSYFW